MRQKRGHVWLLGSSIPLHYQRLTCDSGFLWHIRSESCTDWSAAGFSSTLWVTLNYPKCTFRLCDCFLTVSVYVPCLDIFTHKQRKIPILSLLNTSRVPFYLNVAFLGVIWLVLNTNKPAASPAADQPTIVLKKCLTHRLGLTEAYQQLLFSFWLAEEKQSRVIIQWWIRPSHIGRITMKRCVKASSKLVKRFNVSRP